MLSAYGIFKGYAEIMFYGAFRDPAETVQPCIRYRRRRIDTPSDMSYTAEHAISCTPCYLIQISLTYLIALRPICPQGMGTAAVQMYVFYCKAVFFSKL